MNEITLDADYTRNREIKIGFRILFRNPEHQLEAIREWEEEQREKESKELIQ